MIRKVFLFCGIVSSVLYVFMNALVPLRFEGYSFASQTVSELSAIGAPTRTLWVFLGSMYALLMIAFGWGVVESASGTNRRLRMAGFLLVIDGILSLFWPPMHARGAEFSLTDALHIVWAMATVLLMMLAIGFASEAFGKRFRRYSFATMLILMVFGVATGIDGPRIAENLPTPWVGVWERIGIGAFILWIIVLAVGLLSRAFHYSARHVNKFATAS